MPQLSKPLLERLRSPDPWVEADARAIIAELARSSTSVLAFARTHGLSAKRLYYWRSRIDKLGSDSEPSLSFAPVVVTGLGRTPALTVRVGALELDVHAPAQVEPDWLAQVCAAMTNATSEVE